MGRTNYHGLCFDDIQGKLIALQPMRYAGKPEENYIAVSSAYTVACALLRENGRSFCIKSYAPSASALKDKPELARMHAAETTAIESTKEAGNKNTNNADAKHQPSTRAVPDQNS